MSARNDETARVLRGQGENITREPLPRRWVDLIQHLDQEELDQEERKRAIGDQPGGEPRTAARAKREGFVRE
jgi:hypothetical protein